MLGEWKGKVIKVSLLFLSEHGLWWFISIVNWMEFRITMETNSDEHTCAIMRELLYYVRLTLNEGGDIRGPVPRLNQEEMVS